VKISPAGYAYTDGSSRYLDSQLQTQNRLNGEREIIDKVSLAKFYRCMTPINLTGWGLRYSQNGNCPQFQENNWADIQDARIYNWSALPLIAVIQPMSPQDLIHALGDKASWGLVLTYKLISDLQKGLPPSGNIDPKLFGKFRDLIDEIPGRLFCRVDGTHFFFLGENGAKETAHNIVQLLHTSEKVQAEINVLVADIRGNRDNWL
jgi:hypothetical protein